MISAGDLLSQRRKFKKITLKKASEDLLIKESVLRSIESNNWQNLPDPAFVRGFIKNYASYLELDSEKVLAHYRRSFDEKNYPKINSLPQHKKKFSFNLITFRKLVFLTVVAIFLIYISNQYLSVFTAPKLDISAPQNDINTSVPVLEIAGKTDEGATISVNGQFASVDKDGNFRYEYKLEEGQNIIEVIAAKKLSPKAKEKRVIRLVR